MTILDASSIGRAIDPHALPSQSIATMNRLSKSSNNRLGFLRYPTFVPLGGMFMMGYSATPMPGSLRRAQQSNTTEQK